MSKKELRPLVVPIFIPNQGCPHKCVFCEQERITSQPAQPLHRRQIEDTLNKAIRSREFDLKRKPEVAFFGGTFTGLPLDRLKEFLEAVRPYIQKGFFESIRVSTRPDAMDGARLGIMKQYGVRTVELGAQSMEDRVLSLSGRGHKADETRKAVQTLKQQGFRVGIQLMPGLPGDSEETFRSTITKVLELAPNMVRLYPALVIRGTDLARSYEAKAYLPLRLEEAVRICAEACMRLESEGIPVIRMGLMSSPALLQPGEIVAGPWHPGFGFLVRSRIHQQKIARYLPRPGETLRIRIKAPKRELPMVRGYKNQGIRWIERLTGAIVSELNADESVAAGSVRIEKT